MPWGLKQLIIQDSVPAALTKDKKRLRGEEIAVHLAWKSTLYVTNVPESTDDTVVRELFGQVMFGI
jgi:squamous cell carcinoma antigen recognized by T-cells 3